jgi:hypothetical protein
VIALIFAAFFAVEPKIADFPLIRRMAAQAPGLDTPVRHGELIGQGWEAL